MNCLCRIVRILDGQEAADIKSLLSAARKLNNLGDSLALLDECAHSADQCEFMVLWGFQRYCFSSKAIADFLKKNT